MGGRRGTCSTITNDSNKNGRTQNMKDMILYSQVLKAIDSPPPSFHCRASFTLYKRNTTGQ